jgi:hypothetical protein
MGEMNNLQSSPLITVTMRKWLKLRNPIVKKVVG